MTKKTSPILIWTLVVVSIACFPIVIVKMAVPGFLGPEEPYRRITFGETEFRLLLDTGVVFQRLGRYKKAASWFQKAERSAQHLSGDQYPFVVDAREHLVTSYQSQGRTDDAEHTYEAMVKTSMEAGEMLSEREQFAQAASRFEDAEKFAGNLTTSRLQALQAARAKQVNCFFALTKKTEAAVVAARMVETQRESGEPYDLQLAEYYFQLAYALGGSQDWAGAEEGWLASIEIYDAIIAHYSGSYDPEARAANARSRRDFAIMNLAATYFNEKKMEQALSAADLAYEGQFAQSSSTAPLQLITVGLQSATVLGNQDQEALWQQRLKDLCRGPNCRQ